MLLLNNQIEVIHDLFNGLRPINDSLLHELLSHSDLVDANLPDIVDQISRDESFPSELKEQLMNALPQYSKERKDPKADFVSFEKVLDDAGKWISLVVSKHLPHNNNSFGALTLFNWLRENDIRVISTKCEDPSCTAKHLRVPCLIPKKWINVSDPLSVVALDAFGRGDHAMTCIDLFDLVCLATGQASLYANELRKIQKRFPNSDMATSIQHIEIDIDTDTDTTQATLGVDVMAFREWIGLQRLMHYKNQNGEWTKR